MSTPSPAQPGEDTRAQVDLNERNTQLCEVAQAARAFIAAIRKAENQKAYTRMLELEALLDQYTKGCGQ